MHKRKEFIYFIAVLAVSLIVLANLVMRSTTFPFSPDSASYFEQARSLVNEGTALVTPYGLEELGKAPTALFPIGYPLVLSSFQYIGIDARETSVALSWFSSIVLPFVLYLSFRGALGHLYALVVAALSVSSPGFLSHSVMGLTDVFSLLLASISVGLILNSNSRLLVVIAGLLAGAAYSVRNAHAALLVSFVVYFMTIWLTDKHNRREVTSSVIIFSIGAAAIVIPLIIRNIVVFGSINPYQMEPSTIGIFENIRTYLQEFIYDVTGHRELGRAAAWSRPGLSAIVTMFFLVAWRALSSWGHLNIKQRRTLLLCSIYSFVGACVVIVARSRYQWGEPINVRHTLQYTPFFLATIVLFISFSATSVSQSTIKHFFSFVIAAIASIHVVHMVAHDSQSTIRIGRANAATAAFKNGKEHLCEIGSSSLLISNFAHVFQIKCNAPVRQWSPTTNSGLSKLTPPRLLIDALSELSERHPNTHLVIGLYPEHQHTEKELFPLSESDVSRLHVDGWNIVNNNSSGLLLSR
jgi:hypothetical protein